MMPTRLREKAALRPRRQPVGRLNGALVLVAGTIAATTIVAAPVAKAQYIPDRGNVTRADIPEAEQLETAFEEARWHFGALGVQPWFGIRDASLVTDQDPNDPDKSATDLTVTAGAGVRAYGRPSPKIMVAGHVLPEYVWWQDNDDRSQLNGRYGLGVFGHLNRLSFEVSYRQTRQQRFFSSELPLLTSLDQDSAKVAVSVEVARGISVYVAGRDEEIVGDDGDLTVFSQLDRSEEHLAAGVRLESRRGFWADFGVEESTVEFADTARNLSNEGTTLGVGFGFDRNRLSGVVELAFRDIEPTAGSVFAPFDDVTGAVNLIWQPRRVLGFMLFAQRGQSYSIDTTRSYAIGDRFGLTTRLTFGSANLQLTGTVGEDAYEGFSGPERVDDVQELQASFSMPVGDLFVLGVQGTHTDYDSNLAAFDRDVTSYGVNLSLGKLVEKLRLGDSEGTW